MKATIVIIVMVVAVCAVAEGHTRKALATAPRTATTTPTAAGSKPTTPTTGAPQTIKTMNGTVKVGVTAAGPARTKTPKTTSAGAKIEQSNSESCRSVAARTYCENYEQANCCEMLGSDDKWKGCAVASNLYICTDQYPEKPVAVCCS